MLTVLVEKTTTIHTGRLKLSKEQAELRGQLLEKGNGRGIYNVIKPVQFKAGEEITLPDAESEDDVSKMYRGYLTPIEVEKAQKEPVVAKTE